MRGTATPAATDPARGRGVRSAGTASAPAPAAETGAIGGVGASGAVASRSGKGNERVCLVQKAERLRLDEARRARCGQQVHLRRPQADKNTSGGWAAAVYNGPRVSILLQGEALARGTKVNWGVPYSPNTHPTGGEDPSPHDLTPRESHNPN